MQRLDWKRYTAARATWEAAGRDSGEAQPQPAAFMERLDNVPAKLAAVGQLRVVFDQLAFDQLARAAVALPAARGGGDRVDGLAAGVAGVRI